MKKKDKEMMDKELEKLNYSEQKLLKLDKVYLRVETKNIWLKDIRERKEEIVSRMKE